jgi:hypothetical protein
MIDIYRDIKVGAKFRVNPGKGSHSKEPYIVEVVEVFSWGFSTQMAGSMPSDIDIAPHVREFTFKSSEWKDYHHKRFEKI